MVWPVIDQTANSVFLSDPSKETPATDTMMAVLHIVTFSRLNISDLFNRVPVPPRSADADRGAGTHLLLPSPLPPAFTRPKTNYDVRCACSGYRVNSDADADSTRYKTSIALSSFRHYRAQWARFSQANSCRLLRFPQEHFARSCQVCSCNRKQVAYSLFQAIVPIPH